jgi:hypothetical protein
VSVKEIAGKHLLAVTSVKRILWNAGVKLRRLEERAQVSIPQEDRTVDEIREKLKPHLGKRIKVRGCLSKFDLWSIQYREVGRACISEAEVDGEVVADHVWVMAVQHWMSHKTDIGKQVEFTSIVAPYSDKRGHRNYHLTNPDELQVLHDPPALRLGGPPDDEELPMTEEKAGVTDSMRDPLETLRQVKEFTKAIGGQEQAAKVAAALESVTLPVPQLVSWIKALSE